MDVSVNFLGFQRSLARQESVKVPWMTEMRVEDVLNYIQEHFPQLAIREEDVCVVVNDDISRKDRILESNDHISFFPHIGGG
jgi:molybdopterin converting factor small subunit